VLAGGAVGSGRWRRITVQRADSEPEPRCYRWRLGHDTGPTDNANGSIGGSILYSPFIRDQANLTLPHSPMADTPITSVTSPASLQHPESTFNHGARKRASGVARGTGGTVFDSTLVAILSYEATG
jgi:hypothetical protein